MKILVTGAKGFVGKNLVAELKNQKDIEIFEYDIDTEKSLLEVYTKECDFVFHLAGINRPKKENEFMEGNYGFTSKLLGFLRKNGNKAPIVLTSSIQAELDNPYGKSKLAGEKLLSTYGKTEETKIFIYRLPNLFGKWSKPNYNTVIATFCYNIARDLEIKVNNPDAKLALCYIDDLIEEFMRLLDNNIKNDKEYIQVPITYKTTLGKLVKLLRSFHASREKLSIPNMGDEFVKKLYSTYLSFLPEDKFSYPLKMNKDKRGSFTEFIRTKDRGQVSINISKAGITKGNHWHHTKNEKFLVVSGKGVIRFRKIGTENIIEYYVSGKSMQVIDIPVGYTHNIENLGKFDMITIMWVNEIYNPHKADTYFLEV